MRDNEPFATMARYNRWMNGKLYAAAGTLDDAARKADRGAFFRSIHDTLDHLIFADRIWLNRLAGTDYETRGIGVRLFDDFGAMRDHRGQLDEAIVAWADGLTAAWLAGDLRWTSGADGVERARPRWMIAQHLFNHQTNHRAQAATLLTQRGIDIGPTDLPWMAGLSDPPPAPKSRA